MLDQQGLHIPADTNTDPAQNADHSKEPAVWPVFLAVALFVAGWAASVAIWGVPGLYMPAVCAVPVMFVLLIWISRG